MFVAEGEESVLRELGAFLTPLLTEPALITDLVERAEASGFEFDA